MKTSTLKDIAKIANVSVATVSKALSNSPDISQATKARIRKICNEMQYVPNANAAYLRKSKTKLIGVIISDNANPYFSEMLKNIEHELSIRGYYMLIFNTNEDEDMELSYINELRGIHVAGVIITPASAKSVELLRSYDIPFVLAGRFIEKDKDSYVVPDDEQAGYLATKKILEGSDCQQVFFLGPKLSITSFQNRLSGYFNALSEKNIKIDMNNIIVDVFDNQDGYQIAKKIVQKLSPPYAFVCESDYVATGVLKYLTESGIAIPDMAKVVGIDNLEIFAFSHPLLTTVDMKKELVGTASAEILFEMLNAKKHKTPFENRQIILPATLIEKETS